GPAGCAGGAVRRGEDRRGRPVGPLPPRHPGDDLAVDLLRHRDVDHWLVPDLRLDLHHDPGRAGQRDHGHRLVPLPLRLPVLADGVRRGGGLRPLRDPLCRDPDSVATASPLGLWRGVTRMVTAEQVDTGDISRVIEPSSQRTLGRRRGPIAVQIVLEVLLTIGALAMMVPFLWMISTSLKPYAQVFA